MIGIWGIPTPKVWYDLVNMTWYDGISLGFLLVGMVSRSETIPTIPETRSEVRQHPRLRLRRTPALQTSSGSRSPKAPNRGAAIVSYARKQQDKTPACSKQASEPAGSIRHSHHISELLNTHLPSYDHTGTSRETHRHVLDSSEDLANGRTGRAWAWAWYLTIQLSALRRAWNRFIGKPRCRTVRSMAGRWRTATSMAAYIRRVRGNR